MRACLGISSLRRLRWAWRFFGGLLDADGEEVRGQRWGCDEVDDDEGVWCLGRLVTGPPPPHLIGFRERIWGELCVVVFGTVLFFLIFSSGL